MRMNLVLHVEKRFSSKRTLAFHGKTCLPGKCYRCEVCNTKFALYKQLYDHKRKYHTSLQCDFCDMSISSDKNMMRHVNLKHRGLRPSRAKALEVDKLKLPKTVKSFECDKCEKTFYDKSTLNRHKKVHTFVCKTCEKVFLSIEAFEHLSLFQIIEIHWGLPSFQVFINICFILIHI